MKINVQFAELHTPLFLGGKNFGMKLDTSKLAGLKMTYDRAEKELIVEWNKKTAYLPSANVASYEEVSAKEEKPVVTHQSHPMKKGIASAQVQTPMGHVFQGEGSGQTRSS